MRLYAVLLLTLYTAYVFGSVVKRSNGLKPLEPSEEYMHSKIADEDAPNQYQVFWKFDNDTIQFELHCKSRGWVGFGFSPNGGLKGADIVMGWVDDSGKGQVRVGIILRHIKMHSLLS
jgi:hypothetical protein